MGAVRATRVDSAFVLCVNRLEKECAQFAHQAVRTDRVPNRDP